MIRRRFAWLGLALALFGGPALADEVTGTLQSVSADGDKFVVERERTGEDLRFRGAAAVSLDGLVLSLSEGARVRVTYDQVDNELVVTGLDPL